MRTLTVTALTVAVALALAALPAQAQDEDLDQRIDEAIEKGIEHVWSWQRDSGLFSGLDPQNIPTTNKYPGDRSIMALCALAYYGVDPARNDDMMRGLKAILELDLKKTYTLGLRIIAMAEIYRNTESRAIQQGLRKMAQQDADRLVKYQFKSGAWDYGRNTRESRWDFSNTQLAVLGLYEATTMGVEVPPEAFHKVLELYLEWQVEDGGWNYGLHTGGDAKDRPSYGSMTAAAVASLFIGRDILNPGQGCPCKGGRSAGRRDPRVTQAIRAGVQWLGDRFKASHNPERKTSRWTYYWLYAAQRVGMKTGFKYFGTHNWYRQGAKYILSKQSAEGHWGTFADTVFAILFLIKGRGPVLVNKLRYDGPWDLHPYDAAHLAGFVSKIKEQHMNWQVVHLGVPVEELHDAPILYITAEEPVNFTDEQKARLREFTGTGGTVLLEASCGNRTANIWWMQFVREVWPEWEMQRVAPEHPMWKADLQIGPRVPPMMGISDGVRTFLFYSPRDLSCIWHTQATVRDEELFELGNNLYAYATDRGKLRGRLAGREIGIGRKYAEQDVHWRGLKQSISVARFEHGAMWHVTRHYKPWKVLGADLADRVGVSVNVGERVQPIDTVSPSDVDLLVLTGRGNLRLGDNARTTLKSYLDAGGLIYVQPAAGDPAFDASVRTELSELGLRLLPVTQQQNLLSGNFEDDGTGHAIEVANYTFALRPQRIGKPTPELFGIYQGTKMVGVLSPFDITLAQAGIRAFASRGYAADDARALATNLVLWVCQQRGKVAAAVSDAAAAEPDSPQQPDPYVEPTAQ